MNRRVAFAAIFYLVAVSFLVFRVIPSAIAQAEQQDSEVERNKVTLSVVSRHFSSGYFAFVEDYVEYKIQLTNDGHLPIRNQSLWVVFTSAENKTYSSASYTITSISAGESKTFSVGPFKIRESGNQFLILGINKKGDPTVSDEISIGYQDSALLLSNQSSHVRKAIDTFIAYEGSLRQGFYLVGAAGVAIISVVIIFFFSRHKKDRLA